MRFSTLAVIAVLAPAASGFVVPSQRQNAGVAFRNAAPLSMALEDLENKLLNPEESKKKPQRAKPEPKPKPQKKAPEPKKSKKDLAAEAKQQADELKRLAEAEKAAAAKKVEKTVKAEAKEAKAAVKSAKYTLDTELDKPKKSRVKKDFDLPKAPSIKVKVPSVSVPKLPKSAPKRPKPAPKAVAKSSGSADPNAGPVGVALGAAPLVALPLIGLAAARGALSKTAARRAEIQKEMAAAEEAKKKKAIQADVDGGALAKATVCTRNETCFFANFHCLTLLLLSFATGISWCRCRGNRTDSYCSFRRYRGPECECT